MTQFIKANQWQTLDNKGGRTTKITHALGFPEGKWDNKRRTNLAVVDVRESADDIVGENDTVMHIGYDRFYGDVFLCHPNDDVNNFIILFGKRGDEF